MAEESTSNGSIIGGTGRIKFRLYVYTLFFFIISTIHGVFFYLARAAAHVVIRRTKIRIYFYT